MWKALVKPAGTAGTVRWASVSHDPGLVAGAVRPPGFVLLTLEGGAFVVPPPERRFLDQQRVGIGHSEYGIVAVLYVMTKTRPR